MCNDANRDNDAKILYVSTLTKPDKNSSTTESKNKQDEANSDAKSLKTLTIIENDSVKAKLKQERAELINHFYNIIGTTQNNGGSCGEKDLNVATYCVSNSPSDFHQWLESYPLSELYDHDLQYCGRKISRFCQERRQLSKPKKYRQRHPKPKKQNINEPKCSRDESITFRKDPKKTQKKRKRELAFDRRTKMENLVQEGTFEPEKEFRYLREEECISTPPPAEKSGLEFLLCDENTPEGLEPDLLEFLLDLQDREVTPEDYELLLQLDDSVTKKALPDERVASLETDTATEEHVDDTCGVCMENYVVGETRKILPCGHMFHESCIKTWLTYNSTKCPLDNIDV